MELQRIVDTQVSPLRWAELVKEFYDYVHGIDYGSLNKTMRIRIGVRLQEHATALASLSVGRAVDGVESDQQAKKMLRASALTLLQYCFDEHPPFEDQLQKYNTEFQLTKSELDRQMRRT